MKSCVTVSLVEEARGGPFVLWDDIPAACSKAAQMGFDAIEIFPPSPDALTRLPLANMLDDHGLQLAAVGTGAGWVKHRLTLADPDPNQRSKAIDFVKSIIDVAGKHGASAIIGSMQGWARGDVTTADAHKYLLDGLSVCGRHAESYNVPLLYEPLNRYETNQFNTLATAKAFLNRLGASHNIKLLADLFHMQIEETDVAGAITEAGETIGHVHFVDSNRRPVGLGHTDFRAIIAALRAVGYTGYLSAETFPYPDPDAAASQTIRAFRYWASPYSVSND